MWVNNTNKIQSLVMSSYMHHHVLSLIHLILIRISTTSPYFRIEQIDEDSGTAVCQVQGFSGCQMILPRCAHNQYSFRIISVRHPQGPCRNGMERKVMNSITIWELRRKSKQTALNKLNRT